MPSEAQDDARTRSSMFMIFIARMTELMENHNRVNEETISYIISVRTAMDTEQIKPEILFRMLNGTTALLVKLKEAGRPILDDNDPKILFISEMLEKQVFGYFSGELRGQPISILMPERFR